MGSTKGVRAALQLPTALLAASVVWTSSCLAQQTPDTGSTRAQLEARQLLQGADDRPFLDALEIARVAEALTRVRAAIPEVREITNFADESYLTMMLTDLARAQADTVPRLAHTVHQDLIRSRVGIHSIDSLNAALGADSSTVRYVGSRASTIRPHFREPPNVPVLAPLYGRLEEILHAGPELYLSIGDAIHLTRTETYWYFTFVRASDSDPWNAEYEYLHVQYSPVSGTAIRVDRLPGQR